MTFQLDMWAPPLQEAKRAVNMDTVETQPITDSQLPTPSPIRKMPDLETPSGKGSLEKRGHLQSDDAEQVSSSSSSSSSSSYGESDGGTSSSDEDCTYVCYRHEPQCITIESGDESGEPEEPLPNESLPQEPLPQEPLPQEQLSQELVLPQEPVPRQDPPAEGLASTAVAPGEALAAKPPTNFKIPTPSEVIDLEDSQLEDTPAVAEFEKLQELANSDEEKENTKNSGVFKDGCWWQKTHCSCLVTSINKSKKEMPTQILSCGVVH